MKSIPGVGVCLVLAAQLGCGEPRGSGNAPATPGAGGAAVPGQQPANPSVARIDPDDPEFQKYALSSDVGMSGALELEITAGKVRCVPGEEVGFVLTRRNRNAYPVTLGYSSGLQCHQRRRRRGGPHAGRCDRGFHQNFDTAAFR